MKVLLDTHVMLWLVSQPSMVSKSVRSLILKETTTIFVSAISFWEISLKFQLGKLDLKSATPEMIKEELIEKVQVQIINLDADEATSFYRLKESYHRDPFDRMLIWQAMNHNLIFITDDKDIKKYESEEFKVLW